MSLFHDENAPKAIGQIDRNFLKEKDEEIATQMENIEFQTNMDPVDSMSRWDGRMGDSCGDRGDDRNKQQSRKLARFILHCKFLT